MTALAHRPPAWSPVVADSESHPRGVDVVITNVVAVAGDRLIERATVVVRNGIIESVGQLDDVPLGALDGRGLFCLAGLIDTHSGGLEKEIRPRPSVRLPADFALRSFESRVRSAGITTVFHGVVFENGSEYERSVQQANVWCDVVADRRTHADARVDHRVLYRLDVRDAAGLDALAARLHADHRDLAGGEVPLVSTRHHVPGRSVDARNHTGAKRLSAAEPQRALDEVGSDGAAFADNIDRAHEWLAQRSLAGLIRLMGHDPASALEIDLAAERSVSIAEFPTSVEAARRARDRGMRTVAGAPNVLRGGSHSGNVSAAELVSQGVCDGLSSDYLPTSMLGAVGALVDEGVCDLPAAVALVTSGPADTVGLTDRGRLLPGLRGDLVLVGFDRRLPTVHLVVRANDRVALASPAEGRPRTGLPNVSPGSDPGQTEGISRRRSPGGSR